MRKFTIAATSILYIGLIFLAGYILPGTALPWVFTALSALLVVAFVRGLNAHAAAPLILVLLVTLIFPVAVLSAMAWPAYPTLPALATALISTLLSDGQLNGLALLLPSIGATAAALISGWKMKQRI